MSCYTHKQRCLFIVLFLTFFSPVLPAAMTIVDLPESSRIWVTRSMDFLDEQYDEDHGLLGRAGSHNIRGSAQYAVGLLLRNKPGDVKRACRVFEQVIASQYDQPGTLWHGTFRKTAESPVPPRGARRWRDYDPNWREFVGTMQIIALTEYRPHLPESLIEKMDASLKLAAEGAFRRKVNADYTNIALMDAYLLGYCGRAYGEHQWRQYGDRLARKIFENFEVHGTFDEFNSPTYYGVDMFGIVLWRRYPLYKTMGAWGAAMEARTWDEIGKYYHAGMKNLCGPWDRSYGMDMRKYVALIAFWIGFNVPIDAAPVQFPAGRPEKSFEFASLPAYALLGSVVSEDVEAHLTAFQGERLVHSSIGATGERMATAWLSEKIMIGGGETPPRRFANQQVHPATVHWLTPEGEVGWIRFVGEVTAKAVASKGELNIDAYVSKTDNRPEVVEFILGCPGKVTPDLTATRWALPGLVVTVETNAGDMTLGSYYHYPKAQYALPPGKDGIRFSLRFELVKTAALLAQVFP